MEIFCTLFVGVVFGLAIASLLRRREPRAERLVVEPGEVRLRLSGRMHPDVMQQCFDVAGSKGQHHDLLIVAVDDRPALFLDVNRFGEIRIFSDHAMEVEHQEHISNVRLHIRRRAEGS